MKSVILAAGRGSRLGSLTKAMPKCLIKVLGIPLIERSILEQKAAGIKNFIIVIGYKGEMIKEYLGNGEKLGVSIKYVKNPYYEYKDNLSSVKVVEDLLKNEEKFILTMADHYISQDIFKKVVNANLEDADLLLCVDYNLPKDPEEATKVLEKDGYIVAIGKNLKEWNCVDTGVFLCKSSVFAYVNECLANNKTKWSNAVEKIAKDGKAKVLDISSASWGDVDTESDLKFIERVVFKEKTKNLPTLAKIPILDTIIFYITKLACSDLQKFSILFVLAITATLTMLILQRVLLSIIFAIFLLLLSESLRVSKYVKK